MNVSVTRSIEIDVDPEEFTQLANAFQLAKQNALPGDVLRAQVTPRIAFRFVVGEPTTGRALVSSKVEPKTEVRAVP